MVWYQRKANKYGAQKTVWNGRKYDSKLEAGVAQEIELLRRAGEVVKVEPQKAYDLRGLHGSKICGHKPDFTVTFKDGHQEVWEAKGFETAEWRIKLKLFEDNYPDIIYWVIKGSTRYFYGKAKNRPSKKNQASLRPRP